MLEETLLVQGIVDEFESFCKGVYRDCDSRLTCWYYAQERSCQTCANSWCYLRLQCTTDERVSFAESLRIVRPKSIAKTKEEAVQEAMEEKYGRYRKREPKAG